MQRTVGIGVPIKIEWLNKAAELVAADKSETDIKSELNSFLAFEIDSATRIRKTREILMNVWLRCQNEKRKTLQKKAIQVFKNSGNRLVLHWAMLMTAYPIFADLAGIIGKLANVQDTFETAWLRKRLFEDWGERETLATSCKHILATQKYLGAITSQKQGSFKVSKIKITNEKEIDVLLAATLFLNSRAYYEVAELSTIPQLFPFEFSVSHELLYKVGGYTLGNFGGKVVLMDEE